MRDSFSGSMIAVAIVGAGIGAVISISITGSHAQAPGTSATAPAPTTPLKAPWGDPDLQGIWMDETDTPLQRPDTLAALHGAHTPLQHDIDQSP